MSAGAGFLDVSCIRFSLVFGKERLLHISTDYPLRLLLDVLRLASEVTLLTGLGFKQFSCQQHPCGEVVGN